MLWVGLGNPGKPYQKHRHNIGFMAIDDIARYYHFANWQSKKDAMLSSGMIETTKIRLVKPCSYMNKSGLPVAETAHYFDIPCDQIFVFHDDIELGRGKIRIKQGGGHGGHNGLRDIDRHIGKDYWRVRIGIGRPESKEDVHKWVLSDFSKTDKTQWLDKLLATISAKAPLLALKNWQDFQSDIAYLAPPPKDIPPKDVPLKDGFPLEQ